MPIACASLQYGFAFSPVLMTNLLNHVRLEGFLRVFASQHYV